MSSKKGKGKRKKATKQNNRSDADLDDELMYHLEANDDSEVDEILSKESKQLKTEPPAKSMKVKSKKKKERVIDEEDKVKTEKKRKKKIDKEVGAKPKTKPKRKPKPSKVKKVPTTARKIALTGKARKLPIEEADDIEIDWSDETPGKDQALEDFERARMEEQMKYLEREKINLFNELSFMKHDLGQKTELVEGLTEDYEKLRNDFDNYKKRIRGDIKNKMKFASEKLISELLEVLDNFERTYVLDLSTVDKKDIIKGVKIINNQLLDTLKKDGLTPIKAKGEPFDPYIHEAISTYKTDEHPNNTVLEELQKGYKYKGKVVRPSKVRVSQSEIRPSVPTKREEEEKIKKLAEKEKLKKKKKKMGIEKKLIKEIGIKPNQRKESRHIKKTSKELKELRKIKPIKKKKIK